MKYDEFAYMLIKIIKYTIYNYHFNRCYYYLITNTTMIIALLCTIYLLHITLLLFINMYCYITANKFTIICVNIPLINVYILMLTFLNDMACLCSFNLRKLLFKFCIRNVL